MTFGMQMQVDDWCTMVCRMTWSKVKVKVTSDWKPLKRSRPSVPHGTNLFWFVSVLWVPVNVLILLADNRTGIQPVETCSSYHLNVVLEVTVQLEVILENNISIKWKQSWVWVIPILVMFCDTIEQLHEMDASRALMCVSRRVCVHCRLWRCWHCLHWEWDKFCATSPCSWQTSAKEEQII